jgi:acrylyl-CoA reductase (NADPH)
MFKAWLITNENGYKASFTDLDEAQLPNEDVLIKVHHSSMNYKDGLALTGKAPVVRKFPIVPGIDLAGVVEASRTPAFKRGDEVILNGYGLGEQFWGGYAEYARVKPEWIVHRPERFSLAQCMAIGTAGYSAMLAVLTLEQHGITGGSGDILVTGASGGVGGFSIALLSRLGYNVVASTGRLDETAYLKRLGASEVIDRAQFASPGKALGKERWAGAIDNVGSHTLANVCATVRSRGVVAACGMAQGIDFPATVAPFIVRGVTLVGIDSVMCPMPQRLLAWQRLSDDLDIEVLSMLAHHRPLADALNTATDILDARIRGRVILDVARGL